MRLNIPRPALAALLALHAAAAMAQEAPVIRELPQSQCKITLPAGTEVLEIPPGHPEMKLMARSPAGVVFMLVTIPSPSERDQINEFFVRGFDQGMLGNGEMTRLDGKLGTFRGLPCYTVKVRMNNADVIQNIRVFIANDKIYSLYDIRPALLARSDPQALEKIFQSFEFTGTPKVPDPAKAATSAGFGSGDFAYMAGKVAGLFIVLAVIATVVTLIVVAVNRKSKPARRR